MGVSSPQLLSTLFKIKGTGKQWGAYQPFSFFSFFAERRRRNYFSPKKGKPYYFSELHFPPGPIFVSFQGLCGDPKALFRLPRWLGQAPSILIQVKERLKSPIRK